MSDGSDGDATRRWFSKFGSVSLERISRLFQAEMQTSVHVSSEQENPQDVRTVSRTCRFELVVRVVGCQTLQLVPQ